MSSRILVPAAVMFLSALALVGGVGSHGPSPVGTLFVVCFLAIAPGLSVLSALRLSDRWLQAALVPALSLSIDVIVGGVLSYTGLWSPTAAIAILGGICVAGALAGQLLPRPRSPL